MLTATDQGPRCSVVEWRRRLRAVPDWLIEEEVARRREQADVGFGIAIGDDFLVDPISGELRWRGDSYVLSPRRMEVAYALASAWLQGRTRLRPMSLARSVFRGYEDTEAYDCLRQVVRDLRRLVPGLIVPGTRTGGGTVAYCFAIDPTTPAHRTGAVGAWSR